MERSLKRWRPTADRARGPSLAGRIYANLGRLLGGKIAAAALSLAYLAVAARALGAREYGVLILVHGFAMTVGTLVGFPGWHAVVRFGAQAVAADDRERLARLLRFAAVVEIAGGAVAVAVAATLGPLIGAQLGWSPVAVAFAVPYSFAVLDMMRATPAGYLQLAGRFDLIGWHAVVAPGVRLVGAAAAVAVGAGLHGFLVAWLVAALAESATMWVLGVIVARRYLAQVPLLGPPTGAVADNPGIWRFMLAANADVTIGELSARVSPLIVGEVLGPAAAGLYAIAQRATNVIAQPALILGQAAYAELARLVAAGGDGAAIRRALVHSVGIALLASLPVVAVVALFGREVATLLGGAAFAAAGPVMLWLAVARAVLLVAPAASSALVALGRPGLSVTANAVAGVGLLPLLPLLLWRFGLDAAGWHALLQAVAAAAVLVWFVRRESGRLEPRPAAVSLSHAAAD